MKDAHIRSDALAMVRRGIPATQVARLLSVSRSSVYRWKARESARPVPVEMSATDADLLREIVDQPYRGLGTDRVNIMRESLRVAAQAYPLALAGDEKSATMWVDSMARAFQVKDELGVRNE